MAMFKEIDENGCVNESHSFVKGNNFTIGTITAR